MALSYGQPLLLLFASLFFLPALSDTSFRTCVPGYQYPVTVKTVKISPDPVKRSTNANITITGSTSKEIPDRVVVSLGLSIPYLPISRRKYSLCDITACPVAPGPIVLTFSNVFTEKELIPGMEYHVSISIADEKQYEESVPLMCIGFVCNKIEGSVSMVSQAME